MADGDIPLSDYHKALRGKAAAGLEQLRQKLSISPAPSPRRQGVSSKTPTAYSASVDRLKGLINKYESQKKKGCAMDISFSPLTMPQPDELAPLLNDQHTLLQHLEGQVDYYKDALSILKQKAEMVIEENARLHDQLRSQIVNDMDFVDVSGNKELSDQEVSPLTVTWKSTESPVTTVKHQ